MDSLLEFSTKTTKASHWHTFTTRSSKLLAKDKATQVERFIANSDFGKQGRVSCIWQHKALSAKFLLNANMVSFSFFEEGDIITFVQFSALKQAKDLGPD